VLVDERSDDSETLEFANRRTRVARVQHYQLLLGVGFIQNVDHIFERDQELLVLAGD